MTSKRALTWPTTCVIAVLVAISAYLYGRLSFEKQGRSAPSSSAPKQASSRVFVGRLTKIEPLHLTIETDLSGKMEAVDVVTGTYTRFLQREPWGPGELEQAHAAFDALIQKMNPKDGDVIPPPPAEVKIEAMRDASRLTVGSFVGVVLDDQSGSLAAPIAAIVSTLTKEEEAIGVVPRQFPF